MVGQTISHYRITEKLGEGGMGVVYKAEDTSLQRPVALKFLAPHLVSNSNVRKRFLREARAAAGLNHPNICTVYEIGEAEGQTFISMAYLEGRELAADIAVGPMEVDRVLDLAAQFAEGLSEAHSQGVVHRDIKPANLFITPSGRGVILDFGVAQLASADSKLTGEAATLGTCSYMSPEQARGEEVDVRTDVWALGVVLYEMLSGEPPFLGHYQQAIVYSILNEEPQPLVHLRPELPTDLERIVDKCLAKRPERRYQSMGDLLADLRAVCRRLESDETGRRSSPALRETVASIIVLPFQNRSSDPEDEYFADGVTEDVISTLGKLNGLRVIPRGSAFRFKGKGPTPEALVRLLRVSHVLEGSIRRVGDRLRITVELIEASAGDQVWTERYDRVMTDIFDIQDEISLAIAQALKANLTGVAPVGVRRTTDIDAYRLYLKGRQLLYAFSESGLRQAIPCFESALEHDAQYPDPHTGLADAYSMLGTLGFERPREVNPKAKAETLRALELDETISDAHASLAILQWRFDWDFAGAEQSFRRAIELDAASPNCRAVFGTYLASCGRSAEAASQCRAAIDLDPLSPFANRVLAFVQLCARNYGAALEQARKTLEIEPRYHPARWDEAVAYSMLRRPDEALEAIEAAQTLAPQDSITLAILSCCQAKAGKARDALGTLDQLKNLRSQRHIGAFFISCPFLFMGELDHAYQWVETAVEERDGQLVFMKHHPFGEVYAQDPRYQDVLRRIGIPK